ncbi:MAG: GAF domain-containing protein [Solirubrobacterales bacterium]
MEEANPEAVERGGHARADAAEPLTQGQYETLLGVARSLVSELDLEAVLRQVLTAARDLTGARYAALGILDEEKRELERFVHIGIEESTRQAIGNLPRGRGILGELIRHPTPLRLGDVSSHPRSYGFPPNHPPMKSFLGVPVVLRGEAWGNLYLTEKADGGEFDDADESVIVLLSQWAAIAIENARLYRGLDRRGADLERAVRTLEAGADISRAVAQGIELDELLELIAKRVRDLLSARLALIALPSDGGLSISAAAGEVTSGLVGQFLDVERLMFAEPLQTGAVRSLNATAGRSIRISELGLEGSSMLIAPLEFRDRPPGLIVAIDSLGGFSFDADDEAALSSFAANAAITLVTADSVEAQRLQQAMQAAESERARWARELHDETLQELGALRLILDAGSSRADIEEIRDTAKQTVAGLDTAIRNLQGLLTELRPATLDELGIGAALESLAARVRASWDISVEMELSLELEQGRAGERLDPDLEATIYRLVQEGINNALKHAEAKSLAVSVVEEGDSITIEVRDDGVGFDPDEVERGFGLVGMEERVRLVHGTLAIDSAPGRGTKVVATLPVKRAG